MDDTLSGPDTFQHTQAELHAFNQAFYSTSNARMADIDKLLVQSSIATLTTIPVSPSIFRLSKIPSELILRDLRLDATTPLSALSGLSIHWTSKILLEVALHYRSYVIAAYTGLRDDVIRRNVKHAATLHGQGIGRSAAEVRALHYEYKRRHARYYKDPNMIKCCTVGKGILKSRAKQRTKPRAPQDVPKEVMDGLSGLGVDHGVDEEDEEYEDEGPAEGDEDDQNGNELMEED